MTSRDYLATLERRKIESGGTLIPSLDEWGNLIELRLRELDMNYQRPFITRRPSQRYDFHRMPVEGSYAMRSNNHKLTLYVGLGIFCLVVAVVLLVSALR